MFIKKYSDLVIKTPLTKPGQMMLCASFVPDRDISELFPYLNAVVDGAKLYKRPYQLLLCYEGKDYALYPGAVTIRFFKDRDEVASHIDRFIAFLNDIHARRRSISPNHTAYKPQSVLEIYKLLPRTNCRDCGYTTCMAFADALSKGAVFPGECPEFNQRIKTKAVYPVKNDQGEVISRVTIDFDLSKIGYAYDQQKRYIESLEKILAMVGQEKKEALEEQHRKECDSVLSNREIEVLKLLAEGYTNPEIARILTISGHTVKTHVNNIFRKIDINDRTQAAVWAVRNGIV